MAREIQHEVGDPPEGLPPALQAPVCIAAPRLGTRSGLGLVATTDGHWVTGGWNPGVSTQFEVWDAAASFCLCTIKREEKAVRTMTSLPAGGFAVVYVQNGLEVWTPATLAPGTDSLSYTSRFVTPHAKIFACVVLGGRFLATQHSVWKDAVELWDVRDWTPFVMLRGHTTKNSYERNPVTNITPLGDQALVTVDGVYDVRVWRFDADAPAAVMPVAKYSLGRQVSFRVCPWDNDHILVSEWENAATDNTCTFSVWNAFMGTRTHSWLCDASPLNDMCRVSDDTCVTAHEDGSLRVWNVRTATLLATVQAHDQSVRQLALQSNGVLASIGFEGTLALWTGPWTLPTLRDAAWGRRRPAIQLWSAQDRW